MPRIRSIKPEFWQDSRMANQPALVRTVFLCLISMADDEGRLEGSALAVWRFGSFREDSREVASALEVLRGTGRVLLYEVEGNPYVQVANFTKHQRIDHPSKSKYPAYTNGSGLLAEDSRVLREDSRIVAPDLDLDLDQGAGIKDQGAGNGSNPKAAALARLTWLPPWIPEEAWKGWLEMRLKKHVPNTDRAMRIAVKKLDTLRASGEDPGTVIDQSTISGWTKFHPVSIDRAAKQTSESPNAAVLERFSRRQP